MLRNRGQIFPLAALGLAVVALGALYLFELQGGALDRIRLQGRCDTLSVSVARLQARSLNGIALLNQQLRTNHRIAKGVVRSLNALAACAATCPVTGATCLCVQIYRSYLPRARQALRGLKRHAWAVANAQDQLVQQYPWLLLRLLRRGKRELDLSSLRLRTGSHLLFTPPWTQLKADLWVTRDPRREHARPHSCHGKKRPNCTIALLAAGAWVRLPRQMRLHKRFSQQQPITLKAEQPWSATLYPSANTSPEGLPPMVAIATSKPWAKTANGTRLLAPSWDGRLTLTPGVAH